LIGGKKVDAFSFAFFAPFIIEGVLSVIGFSELQCMDLVSWFPSVIGFWIALPFYQVLEGSRTSRITVINDLLDFVFFFSFDKVWRRSRIVWSMGCCFVIRRQEGGMEDIMNVPAVGEM